MNLNVCSTVLKQNTYDENDTVWKGFVVHSLIQLYIKINKYLAHGFESIPCSEEPDLSLFALKGGSVLLDRYPDVGTFVNNLLLAKRRNELNDPKSDWLLLSDDLTVCAFRDLSSLKNPLAMDVFWDISDQTGCVGDLICFAARIKERGDGSAIVVLHVNSTGRLCEALGCSEEELRTGVDKYF
jgi:hypothetical protein